VLGIDTAVAKVGRSSAVLATKGRIDGVAMVECGSAEPVPEDPTSRHRF
jgi:hypothetical protein